MAGTKVAQATKRQSKEPGRFDDEFDDYSEYFPPDALSSEPSKRHSSGNRSQPTKLRPAATDRAASVSRSRSKDKSGTAETSPTASPKQTAPPNQEKRPQGSPEAQPAQLSRPQPDPLADLIATINESALASNRTMKASIEQVREAGLALMEARRKIGKEGFPGWVKRNLPLSATEAVALIRYAQDPRVAGVDVLPTTAVPLHQAAELLAPLCGHLVGEPRAVDTAAPRPLRKDRRPAKPR